MASRVIAEVLKEACERSIAASQRTRTEMNGVDDRKVLAHDLHFELSDRFQKAAVDISSPSALRAAIIANTRVCPGFGNPNGVMAPNHRPWIVPL